MARSGEAAPVAVTAGSAVSLMPGGNLLGGRFLDTDSTGMSVRFSMPPTTASTSISATARPYLRIFRSRSVEDEERGSSVEAVAPCGPTSRTGTGGRPVLVPTDGSASCGDREFESHLLQQ